MFRKCLLAALTTAPWPKGNRRPTQQRSLNAGHACGLRLSYTSPRRAKPKPRHSGIRDGPTKRLVSSGSVLQSEHHFGLVHTDVTGPTFAKRLPLSIRSWGRGGKERQREVEVEVEVEAGPSGSGLRARFYVLGAGADSLRCSVGWGLGVGCMELWTVNCRDSKVNKSTKIKNDTLAARHHHNQT